MPSPPSVQHLASNPDVPAEHLPALWRELASQLSKWPGNDGAVIALLRMADQLELALRRSEGEIISLRVAAQESGYTEDHLGRLVREAKIPNAGCKGSPRVRRADVPKKLQADPPAVATRHRNDDVVARLFRDIDHSKVGD
jgi:hypothetical protein